VNGDLLNKHVGKLITNKFEFKFYYQVSRWDSSFTRWKSTGTHE
jgi:hypothetical protein